MRRVAGPRLFALALLAAAAAGGAEDEYEVLAESASSDGDGRFVFAGSVSIDGAGLRLRADRLVYEDGGRYEASGAPADIRLDGAGGPIRINGPVIEYDAAQGAVRLPGGGALAGAAFAVTAARMEYAVAGGELQAGGGVEFDGAEGLRGAAQDVTAAGDGEDLRLRLEGEPARLWLPAGTEGPPVEAAAAAIEYAAQTLRLEGAPARLKLPAGADGPPIEAAAAAIEYAAGALLLEGSPASLSYPSAETGELMAATAERISFDQDAGTIVMEGGAQARLGSESIASERISFDTASGAFSAAPADGERVKAIIKVGQ